LIRPQKVSKPLAADRLAALSSEKRQQGSSLFWQSPKPTLVTFDY
jgi:hypothetical protein